MLKIITENLSEEDGVKPIRIGQVLLSVSKLQGKILTIIDASFEDKERAKYVKDLVKDSFSSLSNQLYEATIKEFEWDGYNPFKNKCKNGCDGKNSRCSDCPK